MKATNMKKAITNGNLAEQLQEPSLMGAYEGAGITVLGKGVKFPNGSAPFGADDSRVEPYISIGFLYLIPVLLVSSFFPRPQIVLTGLVCAVLQEVFAHLPESERIVRLIFSSVGFVATGLFVSELLRNRDRILQHTEELRRSIQLRQDARGSSSFLWIPVRRPL